MFQSLKTRFTGGQEFPEAEEGRIAFTEAVDGDGFVLVDVNPAPPQDQASSAASAVAHNQPAAQASRPPAYTYSHDPNVITEEPTSMSGDGVVSRSEALPSTYSGEMYSGGQQEQPWTIRPMDLPFWLSSKLQSFVSCQSLTQGSAFGDSQLPRITLDNQVVTAATVLSSPDLSYDFALEKQIVAADQSVYLNN